MKRSAAIYEAMINFYGFIFRIDNFRIKFMRILYLLIKASKHSVDFNCGEATYAIHKIFNDTGSVDRAYDQWDQMILDHQRVLSVHHNFMIRELTECYEKKGVKGFSPSSEMANFGTMLSMAAKDVREERAHIATLVARKDIRVKPLYIWLNIAGKDALIYKKSFMSAMQG